jgi:hypothetical protein
MSSPSGPVRAVVASIAVTALLCTAACTSTTPSKAASSSAPTTSSVTPTPTPTKPPPKPAKNPFTGIGGVPRTSTIAVKIDDTPPGRPQVGIDKADIVYIEEAEGGLTRLAAVFGTHKPAVGYVRSTRPSDPDLLLQFGKITEAASGGGGTALPLLDKSGIKGWINDRGAAYYSRVSRSSDYINLELDLAQVAKKVKTAKPKPMGFQFTAATAQLKGTGKGTDVRTRVGSQQVEFKYSATLKKYVRYIDGVRQVANDGQPVATTNVIVQQTKIVPYPQDTDVNGNPSQFTITTGKGLVSVFRNGHRLDGTWQRAGLNGGTVLKTKSGKPILLAPGNSWVALVRTGVGTSGT